MLRGLDASAVQGVLPVEKLTGFSFVILKTQQGNDGFDPLFKVNMGLCLGAGLVVLPYAFAYPIPAIHPKTGQYIPGRDPREQAKLVVDRIHAFPEMRGVPICLDLEWPSPEDFHLWGCTIEQVNEWCRIFCEEVERLSGRIPIIYTYPWWWKNLSMSDVAWAARYSLWLAAYVKSWPKPGDSPSLPAPWKTWLFWQWDGDGGERLPNGVDADFCVFNGELKDLERLIHPEEVETSPDGQPIIHPRVIE